MSKPDYSPDWLTEERAQKRFAELSTRQVCDVKTVHYLVHSEHIICLDLNLVASTVKELDKAVVDWFNNTEEFTILPASTADLWMQLRICKTYKKHLILLPTLGRYLVAVVHCY